MRFDQKKKKFCLVLSLDSLVQLELYSIDDDDDDYDDDDATI